jgi:hypothetical protein
MAILCRWKQQNVLNSLRKLPDIFARFKKKIGFPQQSLIEVPTIKCHKNPSSGSWSEPNE